MIQEILSHKEKNPFFFSLHSFREFNESRTLIYIHKKQEFCSFMRKKVFWSKSLNY